MSDQLKGFVFAFLVLLLGVVTWKGVAEYRYYQVVKREHQEFFLDELGKMPNGRPFTRKMFFDAMVAETARAQAEKAKNARKE